ncbi:Protein sey1 [Taphrina deformans PYCC 5710]|uniref:Protein sey1 n=1 Tax=Taphrina deformans (strain PYCC 5710 / ATCC 11124 / CBS 356.35 / IMI 108563 / JCM 9778 / NBRC 8474) TaxID=1097556 RepID=R4XAZ9_TAPDE|nr:Protein sey1 [Taphrina deformans PYCC 5710]|eukprot:CCG82749.1 Protein sey1 [Taphrina deformans PYCC 5710]
MASSNGARPLDSWQIITGDKEFRDVQDYMQNCGLAHAGFNYNVVSVFGSQSTGKSTLLNKLFGTHFATMDTVSRQQTTKGIWIARAIDSNILVMDVEGTDGRERGDDQDFERKSALFSIATSEVLVVNMWETQVGLYNGANMGLLKTVFEVNLQLFQHSQTKTERSLLLFVIRDHLGTTPLDNLSATIIADLQKMWMSLQKPDGAEQSEISDYFDFRFVGLPHKVLMEQAFNDSVHNLRQNFTQKDGEEAIFNPVYHKRIPADGFSQYAKGVWEAIEANKDLDLPTQQELLAQFRCDEIATVAMATFDSKIEETEKAIQPGVVLPDLGNKMSSALSASLAVFDSDASRYHNTVYTKKRSDLITSCEARLHTLYRSQLASKRKLCLQDYEKAVMECVRHSKSYDFRSLTEGETRKALEEFESEARECCIEPMTWQYAEDKLLLESELSEITSKLRLEETKRINDQLYRSLKSTYEEIITTEFNTLDSTLWDRILEKCIDATLLQSSKDLDQKLQALGVPVSDRSRSTENFSRRAWRLLRNRVGEETTESHLLLRLREHFENLFRFDKDGVPIVWKAGDDVDGKYRTAREKTLELIPIFTRLQKSDGTPPSIPASTSEDDDFNEDSILRIMSSSRQVDLISRFRRTADAVYVEAKRSTVSSVASVPLYFYGLLLVLGWNELMALLRNPLYFITIIFAGLVAYAVYTLNLSGPVEQVARAMFGTVFDIVKIKLRDALEISQESVPELLHSTGTNSTRAAARRSATEDIALDDLSPEGKKDS